MLRLGELQNVVSRDAAAAIAGMPSLAAKWAALHSSGVPAAALPYVRASFQVQSMLAWSSAQGVMTGPAGRAAAQYAAWSAVRNAGKIALECHASARVLAAVNGGCVSPTLMAALDFAHSYRGKGRPTAKQVRHNRARLLELKAAVAELRKLRQEHRIPAETADLAVKFVKAISEAVFRAAFMIRLQVTQTVPPNNIVHATPRKVRGPNTAGRPRTIGLRDGTRTNRGLPFFLGEPRVRPEPVIVC
jgi:hypothetical protein